MSKYKNNEKLAIFGIFRNMDEGANLLVLNFPIGSIFGIDESIWKITQKFRGVRNVPPGFHYIFYSSVDKKGEISVRKGFFEFFQEGNIYPIVWDDENEDINTLLTSDDLERLQFRWVDEKEHTTEYSKETAYSWHRLTHYIKENSLKRLGMGKNRIYIGPEYEIISTNYEKETEAEKVLRKQLNKPENDLKVSLQFSIIPRVRHPKNSSPAQISHHYLDKSYCLENLVKTESLSGDFFGSELIAQLQISFLVFVLAGAYEGFLQWKAILILLSTCSDAITKHPKLFTAFLETLRHQLTSFPEDFKQDIASENSFLRLVLPKFVSNVRGNHNSDPAITKQCDLFWETFNSVLHLKIENNRKCEESSEDEDSKPTIVELCDSNI